MVYVYAHKSTKLLLVYVSYCNVFVNYWPNNSMHWLDAIQEGSFLLAIYVCDGEYVTNRSATGKKKVRFYILLNSLASNLW